MEWISWLCLIIILCYSAYPGKVNKLERKVRKLEQKKEGGSVMSKMLQELVGKQCKITIDEDNIFSELNDLPVQVLEVDEEWIKVSYTDKKKSEKTKIFRVEDVRNIEVM